MCGWTKNVKLESLKLESLKLRVSTWKVSVKFERDTWSLKTQLVRTKNREVLDGKAQNEIGKNEVGKKEPKLESTTEVGQWLLQLKMFQLIRKQPLQRLQSFAENIRSFILIIYLAQNDRLLSVLGSCTFSNYRKLNL